MVAAGAAETFAGLVMSNSKNIRLTWSTRVRDCCEDKGIRLRSEKEGKWVICYPLYQIDRSGNNGRKQR